MLSLLLVGSALLLAAPERQNALAADLAEYEAARAKVGRDADAQVRLALWCEAQGLQAERVRHLALAVLTDPSHAMARGLMGLVAYRGRWQRPDSVEQKIKEDPALSAALAEYNGRRDRAPRTADAQWRLALWCEENGLKSEAAAHFGAVLRLEPGREGAWKRLGYKKVRGRWVTDAQLAEEKAEAERQKQADRLWKPRLEKLRDGLESKAQARRSEAVAALAEITDPRAVPMIGTVFAAGGADRQAVAVQLLGQIDAAGASQALAMLAVFGKSAEVRRRATETLKRRDAREFAGLLIGLMRRPIKYKVQPVGGPGMPGALFVEGQRKNLLRQYAPPPLPWTNPKAGGRDLYTYDPFTGLPVIVRNSPISGYLGPDGFAVRQGGSLSVSAFGTNAVFGFGGMGLPQQSQPSRGLLDALQHAPDAAHAAAALSAAAGRHPATGNNASALWNLPGLVAGSAIAWGLHNGWPGQGNTIPIGLANLETQRAAASMEQQLELDVSALEGYNAEAGKLNDRLARVLNDATDQALPADPGTWTSWWSDQLGYAQRSDYDQSKPTVVQVLSPQLPPLPGFTDNSAGYVRLISCFGAGTPVHTRSGVRPIESLEVGDQVLTQSTRTGALSYKPILVVHRNPPSKTFRIVLGNETIVSSEFHRFWKAGQGWVMARDLKTGDVVRTLGGLVPVGAIDEEKVQPVFNLDVAEDADFFVGRQGALVHDNTLPDLRLPPFDAPPSLASKH